MRTQTADRIRLKGPRRAAYPLVVLILLVGTVHDASTTQTLPPGDILTVTCATELSGSFSTQEATLACQAIASPTPSATAPATATPTIPPPTADPTGTPRPTPPTSLQPSPTPSDANASGIVIPPPRAGFERVIFTEFPNTQLLGQLPHLDTQEVFRPRPDFERDCTYKDSSGRGLYCWRATTAEHDGVLDIWLHTETGTCADRLRHGFTQRHDGHGGCNFVSAPLSQANRQCVQDIHLVARYPLLPGRKIAHLLWNTGTNVNGEEDHPEGKLDGGDDKGIAAHHHYGGGQQVWDLETNLQEWHYFLTRFHCDTPRGFGFVEFWMDGERIGRSTDRIPPDGMWYVAQIETYLQGQAIPEPDGQGHVLFDAFAVDIPSD